MFHIQVLNNLKVLYTVNLGVVYEMACLDCQSVHGGKETTTFDEEIYTPHGYGKK